MVTLTVNVPIKTPAYKQNVYNFLSIKISLAIVIAKGVGGGDGVFAAKPTCKYSV